MPSEEELMKEIGLQHTFGKDWDTYFTMVTFYAGKSTSKFFVDINEDYKKPDVQKHIKAGNLRLLIVAITFGTADAIIVWQAKTPDATKAFREHVLGGDTQRCVSLSASRSDGYGPLI